MAIPLIRYFLGGDTLIYTKHGFYNALDTLMNSVELTEETESIFDSLKNDFDERESFLRQAGNIPDDSLNERFDYTPNQLDEIQNAYDTAIRERDFAKRQYRERFWNTTPDNAIQDQKEDIEKDDKSTTLTIADLFSKREGD